MSKIIDAARESAARSVNTAMTAAYWLIGRRIVEFEQSGEERAEYGAALIERLAEDLTERFGRGFSSQNIYNVRLFYLSYQPDQIFQTPSGEFDPPSVEVGFDDLLAAFPPPRWSVIRPPLTQDDSVAELEVNWEGCYISASNLESRSKRTDQSTEAYERLCIPKRPGFSTK